MQFEHSVSSAEVMYRRLQWENDHVWDWSLLVNISSPHLPNLISLKISCTIISPSTSRSSDWFLLLRVSHLNFTSISHISHAYYMHRPSQPSSFDHPDTILWSVQVMKLLIMQTSLSSDQLVPLSSECSHQHIVLIHFQLIFPWCEGPSFTFIQNSR
jgi:hypothetical protein